MCRLCSPATPVSRCPTFERLLLRSPAGETGSGAQAANATITPVTAASLPALSGGKGVRILIKGGVVMSIDRLSATLQRVTCWSKARRSWQWAPTSTRPTRM